MTVYALLLLHGVQEYQDKIVFKNFRPCFIRKYLTCILPDDDLIVIETFWNLLC